MNGWYLTGSLENVAFLRSPKRLKEDSSLSNDDLFTLFFEALIFDILSARWSSLYSSSPNKF